MNSDLNEYEEWLNRPLLMKLKFKPDQSIVRDAIIRRMPELATNSIRRRALQTIVDRSLEPTFT